MWQGVTKKFLKWKKANNILFHSKLFLSTFFWKGEFLDIISAELSLLRLIWYIGCILSFWTCNTSLLVRQGVSNIFTMLNYFTHLTNFKHFGSSTCSYVHNQSHDTYGQHETGGLNLNMWTCWRSKVFEIRQMLLMLFCLNKDQFWFLLMPRTSSAEGWRFFFAGPPRQL